MNNARRRNKTRIREYLFIFSILIVPAIFFCTFYIGVNTSSFVLAFQSIDITGKTSFVGVNNFQKIFSEIQGGGLLLISVKNCMRFRYLFVIRSILFFLIFCFGNASDIKLYVSLLCFRPFFRDSSSV